MDKKTKLVLDIIKENKKNAKTAQRDANKVKKMLDNTFDVEKRALLEKRWNELQSKISECRSVLGAIEYSVLSNEGVKISNSVLKRAGFSKETQSEYIEYRMNRLRAQDDRIKPLADFFGENLFTHQVIIEQTIDGVLPTKTSGSFSPLENYASEKVKVKPDEFWDQIQDPYYVRETLTPVKYGIPEGTVASLDSKNSSDIANDLGRSRWKSSFFYIIGTSGLLVFYTNTFVWKKSVNVSWLVNLCMISWITQRKEECLCTKHTNLDYILTMNKKYLYIKLLDV